jgi:hypothetical protein
LGPFNIYYLIATFSIAIAPPFAGLRQFPDGRGFKQWTGDDSRALMKVRSACYNLNHETHKNILFKLYLPALQGHLPPDVVHTFRSLLEFYYIARRDVITEIDLDKLQNAISDFHTYREVFSPLRGEKGFSLPRQHSIVHYPALIRLFGAPNGLCSSITESKHIRAVKEPWRRSSRNNALFQMLTTNQRLGQLAAARVDFSTRGMLNGTLMESAVAARSYINYFPLHIVD